MLVRSPLVSMIGHCTRRLFLLVLMSAPLVPAGASEPPKPWHPNINFYFLSLPPGTLEGSLSTWLDIMGDGPNVTDEEHGYLRCRGDGAQPAFEVALFRYRDDRPLLALCQGELEGADSLHLEFYVLGPDERMQKAPRSILPVADGAGRRFVLPRHGRTMIVRDKAGNHERRFTWDGARFVEGK